MHKLTIHRFVFCSLQSRTQNRAIVGCRQAKFLQRDMSSSQLQAGQSPPSPTGTRSLPKAMPLEGVQAFATAAIKHSDEYVLKRYNNIEKPAEDKREYRGLELINNLKVLLVSDPTTDKSAAAMDINVGHLTDPAELPGLAHFCEHMLFLGTEKYPTENEYFKFLSEHGGSSNACTSADHTTYFFDVIPEQLPAALDIFAQFFLHPLFTASATDRELNAINSEHSKNVSSDAWRLDMLNKATAKKGHDYSKFNTGNTYTLDTVPKSQGIDVRSALLDFHSKWYSSNIMSLLVLGKESLDELESLVAPLFSAVKDKDVTSPSWPEHPYPPELRAMWAYVVPVKDIRSLNISFPIPDTRQHYKSGPSHYLSHLLGHEGPGSLLSALKAREWCNSLAGGTRQGARGFGFFGIQVDLTEKGIDHLEDIINLVFQYINLLKSKPPELWIHDEQKDLLAMHFRFQDKEEPRSFVSGHVHVVQDYPLEDVLSAHYILTEWRPDLVTELLDMLTPENVRVAVVAKAFEEKCTQTESWYGTKYLMEKISDNVITSWKNSGLCPELQLPPKNEFIPTQFELRTREDVAIDSPPVIIADTPFLRLWFKQDDEFMLPKAITTFELISPLVYADPLSCNLSSLLVLLLRDALTEYTYSAELAGLKWGISNAKYGLTLSVDGYDDKLHVLLDKVVKRMIEFKVDPKRFGIMKELHIRSLKNFKAEQPYQHAVYHLAFLLTEHAWSRLQLLEAAETMTAEMVDEFSKRLLRRVHIEGFIYGNATKDSALHLGSLVEGKLPKDAVPLLSQQLLLNREIQLEHGSNYLLEVENTVHKSSCTELYFQVGQMDSRSNIILELLLHIISEPCFNILRTKEQLGYIVFSGMRRTGGVQGLRVIVQSEKHPAVVDDRIEAFFLHMKEYMASMSESEFARHKSALAAQRLERPKRQGAKAAQLWSEIAAQQYNFDRARVEVAELESVTKEDILKLYENSISTESPTRQKLSVHVVSTAEGGAGSITTSEEDTVKPDDNVDLLPVPLNLKKPDKVDCVTTFKSSHHLYPHATPFINIPRKGAHCKL